jgi:hypothetical protein
MKTRRPTAGALAFVLFTAVAPFAISSAPASAAPTLSCRTSVPLYAQMPNTHLDLHQHDEPEVGAPSNVPKRGIGDQWEGITLGGPDGYIFNIRPTGAVWRYKWLGNDWENGGEKEIVGTGFGGWRPNRITIDHRGDMYGLHDDGSLHVWRFTKANNAWSFEERTLDPNWSETFDMIWASGPGELFTRVKGTGTVLRYVYDWDSQRWLTHAQDTKIPGDFAKYTDVASAGGGVFYTINGNSGELHWYRYVGPNEGVNGSAWADGSSKVVGWGWGLTWQVESMSDGCSAPLVTPPARPILPPNLTTGVVPVQQPDNRTTFVHLSSQARLVAGKQRALGSWGLDYEIPTDHTAYTGLPGAALRSDGRIEVLANSSADAKFRGKTQGAPNGTFTPTTTGTDHGGYMASDPVAVLGSDNKLALFATDVNGHLYVRTQAAAGFHAWKLIHNGAAIKEFTAVRAGTLIQVVARMADGSVLVSKYENNGAFGPWRLVGTGVVGKPAVVADPDTGALQVFVRRTDNRIYTKAESGGAFAGDWTALHTREFAGSPSAVMRRDSRQIEVAARTADELVYIASQQVNGGPFTDWRSPGGAADAASDPTGILLSHTGEALFSWLTPSGLVGIATPEPSQLASRSAATTPIYDHATGHPA